MAQYAKQEVELELNSRVEKKTLLCTVAASSPSSTYLELLDAFSDVRLVDSDLPSQSNTKVSVCIPILWYDRRKELYQSIIYLISRERAR